MKVPPRTLSPGQCCQVWTYDIDTAQSTLVLETHERLLEAPNWTRQGDALILNGDGILWRIALAAPTLKRIEISSVPPLNNDHVLDPDGEHIFLSAYDDWQLYRAPLQGGEAIRISGREGPAGLLHFLHGVSPDGKELAFVGVQAEQDGHGLRFLSAEICTLSSDGSGFQQITHAGVPADGPEYSPDGEWIYFNTEAFSQDAQIARMRRNGREVSRLTFTDTVDWFPHLSPDGRRAMFLAYPPGTRGHPANLWVELMVVRNGDWHKPERAVRLFGGQGTINVNSWSPDGRCFAYVSYPMPTP